MTTATECLPICSQ